MQISIKNPNNLPVIDYRNVKPLQGNLKDLNEKNYKKLKKVLEKRGFDVPLFLWKSGEDYFLMDGHQRQRVMVAEDMSDEGKYEVPYILIEAKDIKEAKSKLLEITSQYGTITQEGFDEFIVELSEVEIIEAVHFDALPLLDETPTGDGGDIEDANKYIIKITFEDEAEYHEALGELNLLKEKYNCNVKAN